MTLLLSIKVPIDLANEMHARLASITKLYDESVAAYHKRLRAGLDPAKAVAEQAALTAAGRRLKIQAITRLYLTHGRAAVQKMTDHAVLAAVSEDKIVRGRPVTGAQTEARRGSRAA